MKILIIIQIIIILAVIIGATVFIFWYRYKTKLLLEKVLNRINNAIDGKHKESEYDESVSSAIEEALNKYLRISNNSNEKMKEEKEEIKELVSDISHQTKTPLSNILLYTQILQEQSELKEDSIKMIDQIYSQTDKLQFLIDSLVKASYFETGLIRIMPKSYKLDGLIEDACEEIKAKGRYKNCEIEYKDTGFSCNFDYKWTLEAIINLLENGIKYSLENSKIIIKPVQYESFIRIDIIDFGIGIHEKEQGMIFQRFYRSQEVSEKEGVGIGLYLSRKIISMQGGYIKVLSKIGEGSTFSVFLPRE